MVKKTLIGYKWTGGGGHINRVLPDGGDYIILMQLLNEEQNITPTAFGIILDDKILSIRVGIRENYLMQQLAITAGMRMKNSM